MAVLFYLFGNVSAIYVLLLKKGMKFVQIDTFKLVLKMKKLYILFSFFILTGFAFSFIQLKAIEKPVLLEASGHFSDEILLIRLKWTADNIYSVKGFKVYLKESQKNEFDLFNDLSISNESIVKNGDTLSVSLTENNTDYDPGVYEMYVESYDHYGSSEVSNILKFTISSAEKDIIFFTSTPPDSAQVGHDLSFTIPAETNSYSDIKYRAISLAEGMEFNSNTGEIKWRPSDNGYFSFTIEAYLEQSPNIKVRETWQINVFRCDRSGQFDIRIIDEAEQPVTKGICELYEVINDTLTLVAEAMPNENGVANFKGIDKRTYYLRLNGVVNMEKIFFSEWYEDSSVPEYSKPIYGNCGSVITVTAKVERYPEFRDYQVSGRVIDEYGNPVPTAVVRFFAYSSYTNENYISHTAVDENGEYSISLSNEYKYIAYCYSYSDTSESNRRRESSYYDNSGTLMEAELINLYSNKDNVDFVLKEIEPHNNSLTGRIVDDLSRPIPYSNVSLFIMTNDNNYSARSVCADKNGRFAFYDILPADYILFAISLKNDNTIPAYLNSQNDNIYQWINAEYFKISENEEYDLGDIVLNETQSNYGLGKIQGYAFSEKNKIKKSEKSASGNPLNGANAFLIDENSGTVNYTNTNKEGKFEFFSVPAGDYSLIVDKVGYAPHEEKIGAVFDNDVITTNVYLSDELGASANNSLERHSFIKIFPNPADDLINISIPSLDKNSYIIIYNSLGKEISSINFSVKGHNSFLPLDVSSYSEGVYFIKIIQGEEILTSSFIISK